MKYKIIHLLYKSIQEFIHGVLPNGWGISANFEASQLWLFLNETDNEELLEGLELESIFAANV